MGYITIKEIAAKWNVSEQMIRRYCKQEQIPGAIQAGSGWAIPEGAKKPGRPVGRPKAKKEIELTSLSKRVLYERRKNNHFGIYEYIQVNLTYSSNRMASNRLTREQVIELFRTDKIVVSFEPMKVDDIIETINHFACVRMIIDNIQKPLTPEFIKSIHAELYYGTYADRKCVVQRGEYRTGTHRYGVPSNQIRSKVGELIQSYEKIKSVNMEDIIEFHVHFEKIRPFTDGNGRVGRLILLKECLRYGIDPFLIDDKKRGKYNRGIEVWKEDDSILLDVCRQAQERFQRKRELCKLMQYCRSAMN